jgi:hypothetical protein
MRAIETCRTATLGGHIEQCDHCQYTRNAYNSCRNRHCPKCQSRARAQWLESRQAELLPVEYFHVVFTLPEQIAELAFYNQDVLYGILFRAASETLLTLGADPKHLGAQLGFFAILHTWGQNLLFHPHLHIVVPGGGLDHERFVPCRQRRFFLPVGPACSAASFSKSSKTPSIKSVYCFPALSNICKRPVSSMTICTPWKSAIGSCMPNHLSAARGRCSAISAATPIASPSRINACSRSKTGKCRSSGKIIANPANNNNRKPSPSPPKSSSAAFYSTPWPPGFQRIRYFGFLANRFRQEKLALCRQLLPGIGSDLLPPAAACQQLLATLSQPFLPCCPKCQLGHMLRILVLPAYCWPSVPPPDSS